MKNNKSGSLFSEEEICAKLSNKISKSGDYVRVNK